MRDPNYAHTWSDTFALRFRHQGSGNTPTDYESRSKSPESGNVPTIVDGSENLDNFDFDSFLAGDSVDDC